ncbi:MAG: homoserine O-acetyltransferase [Cytophagaceae bacterium]|nr:homoserine O-acetyltransferase [Cytophagaceae bacterium]MDW8456777.1 homoserine O-acetyltransferase [Cytophagaceae bacterium]
MSLHTVIAEKKFLHVKDFFTERGECISELTICYTTIGNAEFRDEHTIWICHALTGNSNPAEWWPGMVGERCTFDPEKHYIVCANILGSCYGSTGPLEINPQTGQPYYLTFPQLTIRDLVNAHEILRQHLNIKKIHTCIGGSLGGQQALEWAIMQPDIIQHLILIASNAYHSPWGIAFNEAQRMAIKADPTWCENSPHAGAAGLKAARAIALLSYRSYQTYHSTQHENDCELKDVYKAVSYQQYQGEKLAKRFHAHCYLCLTHCMDSHNVGRNRQSVQHALASIKARTLVIGISSDLLFPTSEQKFLHQHIPFSHYQEIESLYGHDGFLIETQKLSEIIARFYLQS